MPSIFHPIKTKESCHSGIIHHPCCGSFFIVFYLSVTIFTIAFIIIETGGAFIIKVRSSLLLSHKYHRQLQHGQKGFHQQT